MGYVIKNNPNQNMMEVYYGAKYIDVISGRNFIRSVIIRGWRKIREW